MSTQLEAKNISFRYHPKAPWVIKNLNLSVEERPVKLAEIGDFAECGLCGTAAVISPVGSIDDHGKVCAYAGCGPVVRKLRQTLLGIQMGEIPAPDGWLMQID